MGLALFQLLSIYSAKSGVIYFYLWNLHWLYRSIVSKSVTCDHTYPKFHIRNSRQSTLMAAQTLFGIGYIISQK